MTTRQHVHAETYPVSVRSLFALLITPSAIRKWWGASRVIVLPEVGGTWAATWGDDEDTPDYVTIATIRDFEPPHRMTLHDYRYRTREGDLPFQADFVTRFEVREAEGGASLQVTQDGFPAGEEGDAFYAACETGWKETFAGIRRFLERAS